MNALAPQSSSAVSHHRDGHRPRATLLFLRIAVLAHAAAVLAQPVLAGLYLAGEVDALAYHSINAQLIALLALIMIVAAILYWRPGGGRGWPVPAAITLLVAEFVQQILGYTRTLAVHIPLGVVIVTLTAMLTVWALRSGAGMPRRQRR